MTRLVRFTWHENDSGRNMQWFTNKVDARKLAAEIKKDGDQRGLDRIEEPEHVEVPTSRKDLVEWLNKNLSTDNG